MAVSPFALGVNASTNRHSISPTFDHLKKSISPALKPIWKELLRQLPLKKIDVSNTVKKASGVVLDVLVDGLYRFVDQPYPPSQKNFAPVQEIGEAVEVACLEGELPAGFPEGVFVRNGPNPQFGCLQAAVSPLGLTNETWVEGEGMLHALFFKKAGDSDWSISYKNRYVESETFKLEKQRNKPSFIPAIEGDPLAVIAAFSLNKIRLNADNKFLCNTSVFEYLGKLYAISENYLPHEINSQTLETLGVWDFNGDWDRACTSHPKRAPGSGELVIMGIDIKKPFLVVGVVSADGKELRHKVDVELDKGVFSHEIGVTQRYNIIVDQSLSVDISRLAKGGQLLKYDKEKKSRFGVMPRYGDAGSVRWFEVETCSTFHILNTCEDGDEEGENEQAVKVEYHKFGESNYCSGSVFVAKDGSVEGDGEDGGWIATFVHNEVSDETQVHIIDVKDFEGEPVAKIRLPQRVPYGFHGTFMATPKKQ
ncbi:9-cis-epoxycarotenoid dioxygenase NCED4, chloroplastic-like [Rhodamnia argentea]|uniref:9-cis-epoxycarotenoid dioxygenase NCED4, chloroplastic-like n=1 Tax=Rhodamnia argentea TaxID=178133 RepID=A0ABM3HBK8_9MYRT|nr:9-cis-epoxycarotenoid dioxygenase NCED4, chloroplastic-like [Rhodamnia argentea]